MVQSSLLGVEAASLLGLSDFLLSLREGVCHQSVEAEGSFALIRGNGEWVKQSWLPLVSCSELGRPCTFSF